MAMAAARRRGSTGDLLLLPEATLLDATQIGAATGMAASGASDAAAARRTQSGGTTGGSGSEHGIFTTIEVSRMIMGPTFTTRPMLEKSVSKAS